jgi:hypothetical protein
MKFLNDIEEFKLPKPQWAIGSQMTEYLFLKLEEIGAALKSGNQDNAVGFGKEESIQLGTNLFQVSKALGFALNDPERLSSFSRTMTTKLAQTFDLMKEKKIEVIDHTGQEYFPTMNINVLGFEKTTTAQKPSITETIEPTIYFNGEMVKTGKVIVTINQ